MATDERREPKDGPPADTTSPSRGSRRHDWSAFWQDPFANLFPRADTPSRGMDRWSEAPYQRGELEGAGQWGGWAPPVETFQRGSEFVVRADLPGVKKDEITLHVTDNILTIEGERRSEREEQGEGYFRSERSYGAFCRTVRLPEGAIADTAKATFADGVLEVVVEAPPHEVSRGRRIEINESGIAEARTSTIYQK
jgi:HSP20 family protein